MQVAMRFVGNYAPRGLSPQTDGMPVIPQIKAYGVLYHRLLFGLIAFKIQLYNIFIFIFFILNGGERGI